MHRWRKTLSFYLKTQKLMGAIYLNYARCTPDSVLTYRLRSLNLLACSSHSARPLSPKLAMRRFRLGPSGLDVLSFGAIRNSVLDAFYRIRHFPS